MLLTKELSFIPSTNQFSYYRELGYSPSTTHPIIVKIEDLKMGSHHQITASCDICLSEVDVSYYSYNKCLKNIEIFTCNKCVEERKKLTNLKKFGYEYASQSLEIKKKVKKTNLEKYGTECSLNNKEVRNKTRKTNLERYGVEFSLNGECVKEKIKKTNLERYGVEYAPQNLEIKDKIKSTNLERYGVENPTQNSDIRNSINITKRERYGDENYNNRVKARSTTLDRYGVDNYTKTSEYKVKSLKTSQDRFGCEFYSMTEEYKKASKLTNIRKYGVDSPMKLDIIKDKSKKTREYNLILKYQNKIGSNFIIESLIDNNFKIIDIRNNNQFDINLQLLRDRLRTFTEISTLENPMYSGGRSGIEMVLTNYLSELNIDFVTSSKNIIPPLEIDIYLPNHKLGIEINGIYWHSEIFKPKQYHMNKTLACRNNNISLLHFYEDEIQYKFDIVKSIINNKIGIIPNKIYARKCTISIITDTDVIRTFLDKNHIQGYQSSKYNFGLIYENELVSIMTFGYRYMNGKREMELVRFCSKLNTNVVGGANKLFNFFILNNKGFSKIISYSDNNIFNGGLYEKLGFKFKNNSNYNYYWVVNKRRYHRFTFNKKSLIKKGYDPNKTEVEIMHEIGAYRIYGTGQKSWIHEIT